MKKKICMFVWNHFTNDARVLRECTSLTEAGYEVHLVAIHDSKIPGLARQEIRAEGFEVIRVRNQFGILKVMSAVSNRVLRMIKRNAMTKLMTAIIAAAGLALFPAYAIVLLLLSLLILPRKMRILWTRSFIFTRMVRVGLSNDYDYYHCNDLNTLPQGYLCARIFRRKKWVYDSHEVQTDRTGYNSPLYGTVEKFLVKRVDVMIMENHTRAKYIEELYGFYPEVVHNYPVYMEPEHSTKVDLHQLLNIPEEEPILLYQGGMQMGRGLEKIIEAVPLFDRGVVVFLGDGRIKPALEAMVQEKGLESRVRFISKVPVEELLHYTRNAYLGFQVLNNVCFNHYSASSNKLFEYIMSSVPVVACSFPEIQKVVEGENVGVCVDSHDPKSIAQGVNYLLSNQEEYLRMKNNTLLARENYTWRNESVGFVDIYKNIKRNRLVVK